MLTIVLLAAAIVALAAFAFVVSRHATKDVAALRGALSHKDANALTAGLRPPRQPSLTRDRFTVLVRGQAPEMSSVTPD